jgi:hypothetical protein
VFTRRQLSTLSLVVSVPAVLAAQLFACGGSSGTPDAHIHVIDSPGGGVDAPAPCTATASYGAANVGSAQGAQTSGSGNMHAEVWDGGLNGDVDVLQLELYAAAGAFTGDITTGTFSISGADAQYKTCGVCVRIFTDLTGTGSAATYKDDYFATSGSVTLTSVSGSNFAGTMSNVMLQHVTIGSDFTSTPVGDCSSSITSVTMASSLVAGSAAFTGTIDPSGGYHVTLRHRTK